MVQDKSEPTVGRTFAKKIFGLLILLVFSFSYADEKDDAKTAMSYLRNGIDARASGLGNSFVSVTNDVTATYWNPAELSNLDNPYVQFIGMYTVPAYNSPYLFGAISQRIKNDQGGIGFFWHNFIIGNLNFANRNHIFGISYGRSLTSAFRVGMNIKYYYQIVEKRKFESFGFDMSGTVQPVGTLLRLAASVIDMGSFVIEPTVRVGLSYPFVYDIFLLSFDVSKSLGEKFKPHIGIEITPFHNIDIIEDISFRAGFDNFNYSAGAGVKTSKYALDYSYINDQSSPSYTHKISTTIFF